MPNVSGSITKKREDGKAIQLDSGDWYGAFAPAMLAHVSVGDNVEFEYVEKPGTGAFAGRVFRNIKGVVKKAGGSTSPVVTSTRTEVKPGDPPLHTQRCIIRQNALSAAVAYHGNGDFVSVSEILNTAAMFESYTSGDADLAAVKAEMGVE